MNYPITKTYPNDIYPLIKEGQVFHKSYKRLAIYRLNDIFPLISLNGSHTKKRSKDYATFKGKQVWMARKRYKVFYENPKCPICDLDPAYFALEQHQKQSKYVKEDIWFFNMYGIKDYSEVLFTVDHVIPKAKNGSDRLENLQTMCSRCNSLKGDNDPTEVEKEGQKKIIKDKQFGVKLTYEEVLWAYHHLKDISNKSPSNIHAARIALKCSNILLQNSEHDRSR